MKLYQKIGTCALIGAAALGLFGCDRKQENKVETEPTHVTIYNPYDDGARTTTQSGISVALGDIDGDGLVDLVVGSPSSVKYFRNIGDGRFREEQLVCVPYDDGARTTTQSGISVALGDIEGDKDLDLIVGSPSHVRSYINTNGKFNPQIR